MAETQKTGAPKSEEGGRGSHRRTLVGTVTSDKMSKTVVVIVTRRVKSVAYGKYMTKRVKYKAHNEQNDVHTGDRVEIVESRPLSKDKRWRVAKLIEKGTGAFAEGGKEAGGRSAEQRSKGNA